MPISQSTQPAASQPHRLAARAKRGLWIVLLVLLLPGLFALDRALHDGRILRGVRLGPVVLAGLTPKEAATPVQEYATQLAQRKLLLRVQDRVLVRSLAELGGHPATASSLQRAYAEGRAGHLGNQFAWWLKNWLLSESTAFGIHFDRPQAERALAQIEAFALGTHPQAGGIIIDGKRALPVYARPGLTLDRSSALQLLAQAATDSEDQAVTLPLKQVDSSITHSQVDALVSLAERLLSSPVKLRANLPSDAGREATKPLELDLDAAFFGAALRTAEDPNTHELRLTLDEKPLNEKLREARELLERAAQDAQFVVKNADAVEILPSQTGTRIDTENLLAAALRAAERNDRAGELPIIQNTPPKLTTEQARTFNIRRIVGHFTTSFPCCPPRVQNIQRIAQMLNNTLVAPGTTFSVNAAVGPRTLAAGFVPAPSIEDGEMVDTVGGGVSQFATTLYNAVFRAGYDVLAHQPHSYYFARYPMGHEATLSWPKPDLVFRNDTHAGLLILTTVTKTSVSVLLFGDTEGRRVTVKTSERRDIKPPEVQLLADPSVSVDREEVRQSGKIGWAVDAIRHVDFADGTAKDERRKVIYKAESRILAVHPCRIPEGEPGHTGEACPLPDEEKNDAEQNDAGTPSQ